MSIGKVSTSTPLNSLEISLKISKISANCRDSSTFIEISRSTDWNFEKSLILALVLPVFSSRIPKSSSKPAVDSGSFKAFWIFFLNSPITPRIFSPSESEI